MGKLKGKVSNNNGIAAENITKKKLKKRVSLILLFFILIFAVVWGNWGKIIYSNFANHTIASTPSENESISPYSIEKIKVIVLPSQDESYNAKFLKEVFFNIQKQYVVQFINYRGWALAKKIAERREPVILRNTSMENWGARKRWNPKYIQENVPIFHGVHRKPFRSEKSANNDFGNSSSSLPDNTFLYFRNDQAFYKHLIQFDPSLSDPFFPSEVIILSLISPFPSSLPFS